MDLGSRDVVFKESRREFQLGLVVHQLLQGFLLRIPMATKQANKQAITLKGSTALVTEFFKYAVNTCVPLLFLDELVRAAVTEFYFNAKYTPRMIFTWSRSMDRLSW